jgi:CRP/FNR family transcriptional regulator
MSSLACSTCPVRNSAACAALADDERMRLAKLGRHRDMKRGETLTAAGDNNPACATLLSGALKIVNYDRDGHEHILSLVHPAGFVGEMFAPVAHYDIVALTDSKLCVFSRSDYETAIREFPALAAALLRRSAEDLFETRALMDLVGRRSAQAKVAGLLFALAKAASHSPCHPASHFDLPLTRGEIADLLGLTIETVSRQLTRLERSGIIKKDGARGMIIRDAPQLLGMVS